MAKRKGYKADYDKLTTDRLWDEGWVPWLVECRNGRVSRDLFGIWDYIAIKPGERRTLALQVTTASNMAARRRKIQSSAYLRKCLETGWECELWGWKQGGDGNWFPKVERLALPSPSALQRVADWFGRVWQWVRSA